MQTTTCLSIDILMFRYESNGLEELEEWKAYYHRKGNLQ